jgi:hypothetical protein
MPIPPFAPTVPFSPPRTIKSDLWINPARGKMRRGFQRTVGAPAIPHLPGLPVFFTKRPRRGAALTWRERAIFLWTGATVTYR